MTQGAPVSYVVVIACCLLYAACTRQMACGVADGLWRHEPSAYRVSRPCRRPGLTYAPSGMCMCMVSFSPPSPPPTPRWPPAPRRWGRDGEHDDGHVDARQREGQVQAQGPRSQHRPRLRRSLLCFVFVGGLWLSLRLLRLCYAWSPHLPTCFLCAERTCCLCAPAHPRRRLGGPKR